MSDPGHAYVLWGTPHSLYTGKVRSYLIKKGVAFLDRFPSHPDFAARIVPVVKSFVVPVVETPEGDIIQDTNDIIELLERRFPASPMIPSTPVQRAVAMLLDAFGSEYMLPLAMHYRWSYRAQQEEFLCAEFGRAVHRGPDRAERFAAGKHLMDYFSGFLPSLGVRPETIPAMERSYFDLLDALDVHFQSHPYLLGGRPSIADFGMIASFFAHLGRDPVPAALMKNAAPNVFRWTERMNLANLVDGEFADCAPEYPANDDTPATLAPVLRLVFADWGPGLCADAALYNAWVDSLPSPSAGQIISQDGERRIHPTVGPIDYEWRGVTMKRHSAPYGLWRFCKFAAFVKSVDGDARRRIDTLVAEAGGSASMSIELRRDMRRAEFALVLA